MNKYDPCPCFSKAVYQKCCKPYHDGAAPEDALRLMRSRYSAFALNLSTYIMDTTHKENPAYTDNREQWKTEIEYFSQHTRFDGLKILEFIDGDETAIVCFTAVLTHNDQDASFTERSSFVKENGCWLYKDGEMKNDSN